MINLKSLLFILSIVVLLLSHACKKEDVVLEDPGKITRPLSLPLPLYAINFVPLDIFGEIELPDGVVIEEDSTVQIDNLIPINFDWDFDINFAIRDLISNEGSLDFIENLTMNMDFNNGMPFTIYCQMYALNGEGEYVDSLFTEEQETWESPGVNSEGVVEDAVLNMIDLVFDNEKIRKLYDEDMQTLKLLCNITNDDIFGNPDSPDTIVLQNQTMLGTKFTFYLNKGSNN